MKRSNKLLIGTIAAAATLFLGGLQAQQADAAQIGTVTVQPGQTLGELAQTYGTTVQDWKFTNDLTSDTIYAGEKLNPAFPYSVSRGDVLSYVAKRYHTTVAAIEKLNGLHSARIYAGETLVIPVGKQDATVRHAAVAKHAAVATAASASAPTEVVKHAPAPVATQAPAVSAAPAAPAVPTIQGMAYQKEIPVVASAYGPSDIMWQWGGLAYTGVPIHQGIIAVDPNVIPLHSKVLITGINYPGIPASGFIAQAEDEGSDIKGNRIDVYVNGTASQVAQFGFQNVHVYILK